MFQPKISHLNIFWAIGLPAEDLFRWEKITAPIIISLGSITVIITLYSTAIMFCIKMENTAPIKIFSIFIPHQQTPARFIAITTGKHIRLPAAPDLSEDHYYAPLLLCQPP